MCSFGRTLTKKEIIPTIFDMRTEISLLYQGFRQPTFAREGNRMPGYISIKRDTGCFKCQSTNAAISMRRSEVWWNMVERAWNTWKMRKNGPSFVSKSSGNSTRTPVFCHFYDGKKTGGQEAVSSSLATRTSKIPETARFRGFFVLFEAKSVWTVEQWWNNGGTAVIAAGL